jgi:hypothetical protein
MLWLSALLMEETDVAGTKDTIDLLQVTDMLYHIKGSN